MRRASGSASSPRWTTSQSSCEAARGGVHARNKAEVPAGGPHTDAVSQLVYLTLSGGARTKGVASAMPPAVVQGHWGHPHHHTRALAHTATGSPSPLREPAPREGLFHPSALFLPPPAPPQNPAPAGLGPAFLPALGTEQGPWGGTELPRKELGLSNKPPLPSWTWPLVRLLGREACCALMWATVGAGLLRPAGPLALVKNRATYKNIHIFTPYKLPTIDTQMAADGKCTRQGHRRGNNLVGTATGGAGSLPEAWILSKGEMSAQEVGPGTARCT